MTLKDVAVYVKDTKGVHCSYKGVWEVLRRKGHIPYGKPYKVNKKRPEDAEEILKRDSTNLFRGSRRVQRTTRS